MKLTNSKAFAVVLSLLLALSVCLPLSAAPRAFAAGVVDDGAEVPVYPCAVCGINPVDVYGSICASCAAAASAKKSTISLAAAGAPVSNPVAYNVYKLFDADVQDGKACNVRYFYRVKQHIGECISGYSHGNNEGESPRLSNIAPRAYTVIGMPYVFGGCSPAGLDDMAFVSYCVTGKYTRIGTIAQFLNTWQRTTNPQPGDICATSSHAGVYIGNGQMIHGTSETGFVVAPVQSGMVFLIAALPTASTASAVSLYGEHLDDDGSIAIERPDDGSSDAATIDPTPDKSDAEIAYAADLKSAQEDAEFIKEHIADGSTLGADSFGMALARSVAASYASFGFVNSEPPAACPAGGIMVSPAVAALLGGDTGTITVEGIDDDGNAKKLENVPYAVSSDCPDDKIIASAEVSAVLHDKGGASLLRADGSKVPVPSDVPTVKSDGVPVEVDGPGYYLVVDPDILTGDNTAASSPIFVLVGEGNTEIKEKSAIPTLTKTVKEDSTGEYGDIADATLQQSVDFRLVGTLPSNLDSYEKYFYAFHDEVNGLSGAPAALSVSIDGVAVDSSKYAVNVSENGFSVVFADLLACGVPVSATSSVVVEYSATLSAVGIATNVAYVEYSNNPMNEGSHGTTVRDEVNVYSYALNFHKVDNATSEALAGVCFTIKNAAGKYIAADAAGVFESDDLYTWTTDAAGDIKIEGVDADTYTIEEVSTLADYRLLAAPFDVSIDAADKSAVVVSVLNDPAYVSSHEGAIEVRNVKTFELPNTGQLGFVGLLAAGFLVLGGTLVYEVRRRRDAEEV